MSQYQSFFINAFGDSFQCEELNHFLRSHVVIRTVENQISTGTQCGIQILVEYKEQNNGTEKQLKQKTQTTIFRKVPSITTTQSCIITTIYIKCTYIIYWICISLRIIATIFRICSSAFFR